MRGRKGDGESTLLLFFPICFEHRADLDRFFFYASKGFTLSSLSPKRTSPSFFSLDHRTRDE